MDFLLEVTKVILAKKLKQSILIAYFCRGLLLKVCFIDAGGEDSTKSNYFFAVLHITVSHRA